MDPSAIKSGNRDQMQETNDDNGNVEVFHVSSVKHKSKSNSVIDLGRAKDTMVTSPSNSTANRARSQSFSTTFSMDYYTGPESYLSNPNLTTNYEQDRTVKLMRSESINPTSRKDARPSPSVQMEREDSNEVARQSVAVMSVSKHAECYNMDHKRRGKCVIFNHETFDAANIEKREGTEQDVMRLQKSFGKLGFDVEAHKDLSHANIIDTIKKLSELDHTDNDCLCVIVLTHGFQNDLLWATDAAYKLDSIWKKFTADKCKTLAGKPKLFFVQACRGDELDGGVVLATRSLIQQEKTDSDLTSYKIPTHADFLIAHSTASGFCSWRDPMEGTWYIQCLCDVLDEYGAEMDLVNMLTLTARKVAMDRASRNDTDETMNRQKQVPSVTTMLIRSLYFPPKSNK